MTKCIGCGIKLQNNDEKKPGYVNNIDNKLCQRCFKIRNYNKHDLCSKGISNIEIISKINLKKAFTLFLCDIFSLNNENVNYYNAIENEKIFVVTKMDLISKNIKLDNLKKRIMDSYKINDVIFVSIINNYGLNDIKNYINKYDKVLFCGPTSSGKSSLLNKITGNELTVSSYKNTTQEFINTKFESTLIIDSPGFNNDYIFDNLYSKGAIKSKTFHLKKDYELYIDKYVINFDKDVNITLFLDKSIIIKTKKNVCKNECNLKVKAFSDLIINNLGFIYINSDVNVYISNLDNIEVRKSIIGGKHE